MKYKPCKTQCSSCSNPRRPRQRTCLACHAAEMREQRKKAAARVQHFRQMIGQERVGRECRA